MKELSIEDKAKRYDEAIEELRGLLEGVHEEKCEIMEDDIIKIFPELKGEDERVINNIKKAVEYYWSDEPLQEILAWLEKQCEQKPAIKLERDDNGKAVLTPFEAELFSMMSEAWQGYSLGEEVNIAKIVKEHSKELLERANEQKPAWNEEDEKLFRCAIDAVKQESKVRTDGCLDEEVGEMVTNWLKSLKDRVQPQSKHELNKKDIDIIRYIGNAVTCEDASKYLESKGIDVIEVHAWLESIKYIVQPQNTWKPSDEQMQALCSKLPLLTGSGNEVQRVLETLYCDLKKLRNE